MSSDQREQSLPPPPYEEIEASPPPVMPAGTIPELLSSAPRQAAEERSTFPYPSIAPPQVRNIPRPSPPKHKALSKTRRWVCCCATCCIR
ncbi:hypothetical protein BX666DRAFT_1147687 [Dichotomocladium elegans]|nr:hypothetical protein BX666DRAFT_1147687 [Dichotomocladium elegans]